MLQRLTRSDRLLLALSVLILVFITASCIGAEWCRHNYYCPNPQPKEYANNCATSGFAVFFRNVWCWFDALREDINALATTTLACLTVILAYATSRQANLTRRTADIAERALIELERPYIAVDVPESGITLDVNGNFIFLGSNRPRWEAVNYGRTPALLIDREIKWLPGASGSMPDAINPIAQRGRKFPAGCLAAENRPYSEIADFPTEFANAPELLTHDAWRTRRLFFVGYIRYSDLFGGVYINGFCLRFDPVARRFVRVGGDAYNYTHVEKKAETNLLS